MLKPSTFTCIIYFILACILTWVASVSGTSFLWMWFAPIPLLLIALTQKTRSTVISAVVVGGLSLLPMAIAEWHNPGTHSALMEDVIIAGIVNGFVLWLFQKIFRVGGKPLGVLIYPCLMVVSQFFLMLYSPNLSSNIVISQMNFWWVLQLCALTGHWGVIFLISLFAAGIAIALVHFKKLSILIPTVLITLFLLVLSFVFALLRLDSATPNTPRFGLIHLPQTSAERASPALALQQLNRVAPSVQQLAKAGDAVILLPEDFLTVIPQNQSQVAQKLSEMAKANKVLLVLGLQLFQNNTRENVAWITGSNGQALGQYRKQHLNRKLDRQTLVGNQIAVINFHGHRYGVAIGTDLVHPRPAKDYGKQQIQLMLIPAMQGGRFADISIIRGIENGYSVIRNAADGTFTAADSTGALLLNEQHITKLKAQSAVFYPYAKKTFYQTWGNAFAWLCLIILLPWFFRAYWFYFQKPKPPKSNPDLGYWRKDTHDSNASPFDP